MSSKGVISVLGAVLATVAMSCGRGAQGKVIVRVGDMTITTAALAQRMSAIATEHLVPDPPRYTKCIAHQKALAPESVSFELESECRRQYRALRRQALDFLISSSWLTGEAEDRGLGVFNRAGPAERKIRRLLENGERQITATQIADYYRRNLKRFERREGRFFIIAEQLKSVQLARRVKREALRGKPLPQPVFHQYLVRPSPTDTETKRPIVKAIFAAKLHVLSGPMPLSGHYSLFKLTRIVPTTVQPFAHVRRRIANELANLQRRRTLAGFIATWRSKWIAKTDCSAGYVVQKCSQYRGQKTPENPLTLD
jgi:hypothetical protein